jgi:hypothetical protein
VISLGTRAFRLQGALSVLTTASTSNVAVDGDLVRSWEPTSGYQFVSSMVSRGRTIDVDRDLSCGR